MSVERSGGFPISAKGFLFIYIVLPQASRGFNCSKSIFPM